MNLFSGRALVRLTFFGLSDSTGSALRRTACSPRLANIFRVPDLRNKVVFTLAVIALYQIGANVPVRASTGGARCSWARSQSCRRSSWRWWHLNRFPFYGTTLLISVGVALETMRQIDSQLMMRNYEGFLKQAVMLIDRPSCYLHRSVSSAASEIQRSLWRRKLSSRLLLGVRINP